MAAVCVNRRHTAKTWDRGEEESVSEVTAYQGKGASVSKQEVCASKECGTKMKAKKSKKGKKKDAEKKHVSSGSTEDLVQNFNHLKIKDESGLLERGPDRKRDCHEIRQSKPYDKQISDDDISPFINSIWHDEKIPLKPTASVSPQTRVEIPSTTHEQLQIHQLQQPQLLQQQQPIYQMPQTQQFLQQSQQQMQQFPQQLQQTQQLQNQTNSASYSHYALGGAPPSIPQNIFGSQSTATSQMPSQGALVSYPLFVVPIQLSGQTYFVPLGPQVTAQSQASGARQTQGLSAALGNSQTTDVTPTRGDIPTVVPDEFVDDTPMKRTGRGRKTNPKGKVNNKKKTPKKATSKSKVCAVKSTDGDNANIDAQTDCHVSGVSAPTATGNEPQSASQESVSNHITDIFESSTGRPMSEEFVNESVDSCTDRPGGIGPGSVGSSFAGSQMERPRSTCNIGTQFDFLDLEPSSIESYLPSSVGSVALQSVGTGIDTDDDASVDINDFLKNESKPDKSPHTQEVFNANYSTNTIGEFDASFQDAEEIIASDLKDSSATRQNEPGTLSLGLQDQIDSINLEFRNENSNTETGNALDNIDFGSIYRMSNDPGQSSQDTQTPPEAEEINESVVSSHASSNLVDRNSGDGGENPFSLPLARILFGLTRVSPKDTFSTIMKSYQPIEPKRKN